MNSTFPRSALSRALRLKLRDEEGRARLTMGLMASLRLLLEREDSAPLVVLEGENKVFCEGLDLEAWASPEGDSDSNDTTRAEIALSHYSALLAAIEQTPRPVVAVVDGAALGGGVGLAAACDLVIASPRASFSLPETVMGLIPAMLFPTLARRIGVAQARLMALGGVPMGAEEAHRLGLVDEIAPDLEMALARRARRFARSDPRAVRAIKSLVAMHFCAPPDYNADAALRCTVLLSSRETRARIARFAEGRAPWEETP